MISAKELKTEIDEEIKKKAKYPKIKGWVARDKDNDVYVYLTQPSRFKEQWVCGGDVWVKIPHTDFPELKWEDEPIEVELTINRV